MSVPYYGDFAEDDTVLIPFNTFTSDDPSASVTISDLADADIKVHKDGGTTEIATDGATVAIDYDSRTGAHLITIDTSAHSDYATGSEYAVLIEGTTVDGATITAWVGAFSIERAGGVLAVAKLIQTAVITNAAGTDVAADIIAVKAETADILTDTGTTIPGTITTAQNDLDTITGTAGVLIATDAQDLSGSLDVNTKTFTAGSLANATFNADVGSTAHGTNIIALACRKILEELNLDHLLKVDTTVAADGDLESYCVAGTIMGHLLSTSADATLYKASTDSLQAVRDHIGNGTNLTEAGGDGDHLTESGGDGDQLTAINLPNQTMDITGNITGNLSGSVGSVTTKTGYALSTAGIDAIRTEPLTDAETLETIGGMIHAIYCAQMQKQTVTASARVIYKLDDTTTLRTQTLADDDTTVTRGGG